MATYNMYPLTNYSFGVKDALEEKDKSIHERMTRYRANYMAEGMRTSVRDGQPFCEGERGERIAIFRFVF